MRTIGTLLIIFSLEHFTISYAVLTCHGYLCLGKNDNDNTDISNYGDVEDGYDKSEPPADVKVSLTPLLREILEVG